MRGNNADYQEYQCTHTHSLYFSLSYSTSLRLSVSPSLCFLYLFARVGGSERGRDEVAEAWVGHKVVDTVDGSANRVEDAAYLRVP